MEILIRIDWISVTDKNPNWRKTSVHPSIDGKWTDDSPRLGYTLAQKHETGVVAYKNFERPDMGRHVIYSSKTLDRIQEMYKIGGTDILIHHIKSGHNVARLDLAVDFRGYGAHVSDFVTAFKTGNVKTKLRTATIVTSLTQHRKFSGDTLYIGSMKKRKNLVRVYDKAAEQGKMGDWVRVELQIMSKKATSTAKMLTESENIKSDIIAIIRGVADFPTVECWRQLTVDIDSIKMETIPKTIGDTERWLLKQVVPALSRTIILNVDFWIKFKLALSVEYRGGSTADDIPF